MGCGSLGDHRHNRKIFDLPQAGFHLHYVGRREMLSKIIEERNNMEKRQISFSPPDISELEIAEVAEALRSGWITTGPRTKLLERRLAAYVESGKTDVDCTTDEAVEQYSNKVVCLNSATAAEELNLRVLGIRVILGADKENQGFLMVCGC